MAESVKQIVNIDDLQESIQALVSIVCERDKQIKFLQNELASGGTAHCQMCSNKWSTQKMRIENLHLEKLISEMRQERQGNQENGIGSKDVSNVSDLDEDEFSQKANYLLHEVLKENHQLKKHLASLKQANERGVQLLEEAELKLRDIEQDQERCMSENIVLHKLLYKQRKTEYLETSMSRSQTLHSDTLSAVSTLETDIGELTENMACTANNESVDNGKRETETTPRNVNECMDGGNNTQVFIPRSVDDIKPNCKVKYLTHLNLIHVAQVLEVDTNGSTLKLMDDETKHVECSKFGKILLVWK